MVHDIIDAITTEHYTIKETLSDGIANNRGILHLIEIDTISTVIHNHIILYDRMRGIFHSDPMVLIILNQIPRDGVIRCSIKINPVHPKIIDDIVI